MDIAILTSLKVCLVAETCIKLVSHHFIVDERWAHEFSALSERLLTVHFRGEGAIFFNGIVTGDLHMFQKTIFHPWIE